MGAGTSKKHQVTPVIAQISVQPRAQAPQALGESILDQSRDSLGVQHGSSEDTLKKESSRTSSNSSNRRPIGSAVRRGGGMGMGMGGGIGMGSPTGDISRPLSTVSGRQRSGRGYRKQSGGAERLRSPTTSGLPLYRHMENFDLGVSQRSQRLRTVGHLFQEINAPENDVIFLRLDPNHTQVHPASCCQLCGNPFTNLGVRAPLLLLCGHSYCSSCLEKACESCDYPTALKCGICLIVTPLDQLSPKLLPQNEAVLELIGSKEYAAISVQQNPETCAECERRTATQYCSECSASFCETCGKRTHENSRVRSRHKPVPVNLKPRPQPTCKKHPGQSCVLYCETEKQPMCVLCKFYNQHRFHKFELMSKVASKYHSSVQEKLKQLEQAEKELGAAAESLHAAVGEINTSARKVQERLEKHFQEMKKSYLSALERREAMLLSLVDRQVDIKQEILAEMRLEVAAARARVLAAHEEASKLVKLNPVSGLLSRRHADLSLERALSQTITSHPHSNVQPDVPLTLLPEITTSLLDTLNQHGAILQLPPRPQFKDSPQVATNTITLDWEVQDQNADVSSDRTLTFSLHCYSDIPYKTETKLTFRKKLRKLVTPESGFEEMSELSSESKSTFPSLPPSLLGSRNVSSLTQQDMEVPAYSSLANRDHMITEEMEEQESASDPALKSQDRRTMPSLLPEPIRLPKRRDGTKLPQLVTQSAQSNSPLLHASTSGGILNLPPLILSKQEQPLQLMSVQSVATTSGVFEADNHSGHMSAVDESDQSDPHKTSRPGSSTSLSELSGDEVNEYTDLGRYCQGFAFEEIYCGGNTTFQYSGLVGGASYYFRVRCHNAAGWGPWSDTVKCMTTSH